MKRYKVTVEVILDLDVRQTLAAEDIIEEQLIASLEDMGGLLLSDVYISEQDVE